MYVSLTILTRIYRFILMYPLKILPNVMYPKYPQEPILYVAYPQACVLWV